MKSPRSVFCIACVRPRIAPGWPDLSPPAADSRFELIECRVIVFLVDARLESVRSRGRFDRHRVVLHDMDEFVVLELESVSARFAIRNEGYPRASGNEPTVTMSHSVVVHDVDRQRRRARERR